ncbi:MAG: hypothetical protein HZB76_02990 [Chlamydiae bacterium]|nr:hypothetical protein [Chlamydiota bacterium]
MIDTPANFSSPTGQDPHKYFRNLCKAFIKMVKEPTDFDTLEFEMEKMINASKAMKWHNNPKGVYKKTDGEKALDKVFDEFKRYIKTIRTSPSQASTTYLLGALDEVLRLSESQQVS